MQMRPNELRNTIGIDCVAAGNGTMEALFCAYFLGIGVGIQRLRLQFAVILLEVRRLRNERNNRVQIDSKSCTIDGERNGEILGR